MNELVREALYPYPSDLAIVSKVGARRDEAGAVLANDEPDELRAGLEENLVTRGLDRLAAVNLRLMDGSKRSERFDAQLAALIEPLDEGLASQGVQSNSVTAARHDGYTVSTINLAETGTAYAVITPQGLPLYTFSDEHAAFEEAALLNGPLAAKQRAASRFGRDPLRRADDRASQRLH